MKIYLDSCSLNLPFDDQTQQRIHLETEAVLILLSEVQQGKTILVSSDALDLENGKSSDAKRKERIEETLSMAGEKVTISKAVADRANALETLGFGAFDALHIACAETAAEVLLTTDDSLLKRAQRLGPALKVRVANPSAWILEINP